MSKQIKTEIGFVPFSQKLNYSIASGGGNIITTVVGSFISAYLTDSVGIAVAAVATMMLVGRVFDLFTDFLMGTIVDRTHTRLGKARPWLAISAPLIALSLILCFSVPENMNGTGKLIYTYLTYLFVNAIAFTIFFISHSALLSCLTLNGQERQKIASMEQIINQVGSLAVTTFWVPLVNYIGYRGTAAVYGIAAAVFILFGFLSTKEVIGVNQESNSTPESKPTVSFRKSVSCLAKNKYFWLEVALFCLLLLHNMSTGTVTYYYCNSVLGNTGYVAVLSACSMIPSMIMNFLLPSLVAKKGRRKIMLFACIVTIATSFLMGLFSNSIPIVAVLYALKGFVMGAMFACAFALTGDVVDYGEWKYGIRTEGIVMSGVSIGQKAGMGFGPAIAGWILAVGGYDGLTETQTASAIASINFSFTYLAAIIGIVMLLVCLVFDIEKYSAQIQETLTRKHSVQ